MSGKGGVGKSTITTNLAAALAAKGRRVGVLDGDVYGPSLGRMLGLAGAQPEWRDSGVVPPRTSQDIAVMSMDFLLQGERAPVVWDGPKHAAFAWKGTLEMHALREFLTDTAWGELDHLLIDLPPGTNQFTSLAELLGGLDGTIAVSIPTAVSRQVVNRSLAAIRQASDIRLLGVVENMSGYYCAGCASQRPLFGDAVVEPYGDVPVLGRIPFDPAMATASDSGTPYVIEHGHTPVGQALNDLAATVESAIAKYQEQAS
jgi:Mrp family chromosome partitioning ATPase